MAGVMEKEADVNQWAICCCFSAGNKITPAWRPLVPPSAKKIHFSSVSERVPHTHKRSFGQPTPETHPELMVKGEGESSSNTWII